MRQAHHGFPFDSPKVKMLYFEVYSRYVPAKVHSQRTKKKCDESSQVIRDIANHYNRELTKIA